MGGDSDERAKYLSDGLHLSLEGNQRLFKSFQDLLTVSMPSWTPEKLPTHMADWRHLADQFPAHHLGH